MIYITLVTILLFITPFQCAFLNSAKTFRNIGADISVLKAQSIGDVPYLTLKARVEMGASFSQSDNRVILLDNDGTIKPFRTENTPEDQARITQALRELALDPRNEIWIVTARDVSVLEKTFGNIDNLNLAGMKGTQFSKTNKFLVELPDAGPIKELENTASQFISERGIISNPDIQKYFFDHYIPYDASSDKLIKHEEGDQLSQTLKNLIKSDPKYDNYEVRFLVEEENKHFRVLVMHKTYLHKGILA
ncbi:hypothetical protein PCASD_23161 [Puccinia coronata f. sp. avenae]|uniref:Trehalose-phosphatase n=1 Tax=Puccinia coronata f. sp. avenae TaxID=200324 RepID=A0A2N5SLD2_9BASI|nr:hypothetical protein PCASD_23161 [Puccinia coronata f. sp. avenae]